MNYHLSVSCDHVENGTRVFQASKSTFIRLKDLFSRVVSLQYMKSVYYESRIYLFNEILSDVTYEYENLKKSPLVYDKYGDRPIAEEDLASFKRNVLMLIERILGNTSVLPKTLETPEYLYDYLDKSMVDLAYTTIQYKTDGSQPLYGLCLPIIQWNNDRGGYDLTFDKAIKVDYRPPASRSGRLLENIVSDNHGAVLRLFVSSAVIETTSPVVINVISDVLYGQKLNKRVETILGLGHSEYNTNLHKAFKALTKIVASYIRNVKVEVLPRPILNLIKFTSLKGMVDIPYFKNLFSEEPKPVMVSDYQSFVNSDYYMSFLDVESENFIGMEVAGDELDLEDDPTEDDTLDESNDLDDDSSAEESTDDNVSDEETEEEPEEDSSKETETDQNDDKSTITIEISDPTVIDLDGYIYRNEVLTIINSILTNPPEDITVDVITALKRIKLYHLFLLSPITLHELLTTTVSEYYTIKVKVAE